MLAALVLAVCTHSADAADWPSKPVRIISPFAPGGTSDTLARLLAEQLSETFGQQFFVENKGGAGGLIGSAAVGGAEPDGYAFVISSIGTHVTSLATSPNPPYDPLRNFSHIAYIGGPPNVIVVHPSLAVTTFKDLIAAARARRDPLNYISPGPGTVGHLVPELLARKESIALAHVSYKGATTWFGFSGPAGVPQDIVGRLNADIVNALDAPFVRKRLEAEGIETEKMSADEFTRFVAREIARWGPIAKSVAGASATGMPR
jgi:tripartite-type tricarboxylate transporter receptor subunit TctC